MSIKSLMLPLFILTSICTKAQQSIIQLYKGAAPGSETWTWDEQETTKNPLNTRIVYNVTHPTLGVFLPDSSIANGTSVIICPGGGYQILIIDWEGNDIARWLNQRGIAAFVLKYRLRHLFSDDPWTEMIEKTNRKSFYKDFAPMIRLQLEDAKASMLYLRQHAAEYNIDPERVGIMGFSAGGTVAADLAYNYTTQTRPAFAAMLYAPVDSLEKRSVQKDAPPLFIAAATDDQVVPVCNSVHLYEDWLTTKHSVELHVYSKGGHGLGDLPSNSWKDRFSEWLNVQGLLKSKNK